MRLGFPVRAFGLTVGHRAWDEDERPEVYGHCLVALGDMVRYLAAQRIRLYRLHARIVPRWAGQDEAAWARLLDENGRMIALLGEAVRAADLRLTMHPFADVVLNAPEEARACAARRLLAAQARLMTALGQGPEGIIVLHVGGVYGDKMAARERFCASVERLSSAARERLALEHDDRRFDLCDALWIHERCGVPIVFDALHHRVFNEGRLSMREGLMRALETWPAVVTPLVHYVGPRTEMRRLRGMQIKAPTWTEHADYVNPFAFCEWLDACRGMRDFDIMLEAKARDLALLQLCRDVRRFFPQLAETYPDL